MNGQAEWGYVYKGQVLISGVDENGANQVDTLNEVSDIKNTLLFTQLNQSRGTYGTFRKVKRMSSKVWQIKTSISWLSTTATSTRLAQPLWSTIGSPTHQKTFWQRTSVSHTL